MGNWIKKSYRRFWRTGGGLNYYITIYSNGRKQIEIFEETAPTRNKGVRRTGKFGLNIGTRKPGTTWDEFIMGDYELVRRPGSFKEAHKIASQYMRRNP